MIWWRAILPAIAIPAALLVFSIGLDLWVAAPLTSLAVYTSAGLLAMTIAALATMNLATGLVIQGKLGLLTASRSTYMIGLWTASLTLLVAGGILYPILTGVLIMRMLGFYWPDFAYFLTLFCFICCSCGLYKLLPSNSQFSILGQLQASGVQVNSSNQPELFALLERLSDSIRVQMPKQILLSIDPSIFCTAETVLLEGAALEGGMIHLSLPLCRILSEAELTSLVVAELLRSQLLPHDFLAWLNRTQNKWAPIRNRMEESSVPLFRFAFAILWNWLDLARDWQELPVLISFQRSAVIAGRENLASAITKASVFGSKWPDFLADMQTALQRDSQAASRTNLSAAFVQSITEIAPHLGQELLGACKQDYDEKWAVPCYWIRSLGVDPVEIAARLAAPPSDTSIACLTGIEDIESDLSQIRIGKMFFLPNREIETKPSTHEDTPRAG